MPRTPEQIANRAFCELTELPLNIIADLANALRHHVQNRVENRAPLEIGAELTRQRWADGDTDHPARKDAHQ